MASDQTWRDNEELRRRLEQLGSEIKVDEDVPHGYVDIEAAYRERFEAKKLMALVKEKEALLKLFPVKPEGDIEQHVDLREKLRQLGG